jgi:hypothetical protein
MGAAINTVAAKLLADGIQSYYPSTTPNLDPGCQFSVLSPSMRRREYLIVDRDLRYQVRIPKSKLDDRSFDLIGWYMEKLRQRNINNQQEGDADLPDVDRRSETSTEAHTSRCLATHSLVGCSQVNSDFISELSAGDELDDCPDLQSISDESDDEHYRNVPELDRDSSWNEEDFPFSELPVEPYSRPENEPSSAFELGSVPGSCRISPQPIVVTIEINGFPARALLDSGSLLVGDFISPMLIDQLSVPREMLDVPLLIQLAVQGSRCRVTARATVNLTYQSINETRTFDVINLNDYDVVLGTPWLYRH